jgi:primosomal protein N' (replication factor Y)
VAALKERIARGEQSLVFLNRRGYAPVLHCGECGWKSGCPHCSAWRVFHKLDRTLRCHHCGYAERVPRACPECGNLDIAPIGRVTKGHDFRRITLVAAVNPDTSLFSSDFRAPERLFALLMQAAGRAGRDAQHAAHSEMWVQTWHPRHSLYAALRRHDYAAFAESQLAEREAAGLPPYAHLALLRADARTVQAARGFLEAASGLAAVLAQAQPVTLYAPVPPTVSRVADVERMQMLVESPSRTALQRFLAAWMPQLHTLRLTRKAPQERILRWAVDVDPLSI